VENDTKAADVPHYSERIFFGAAFYDEYRVTGTLETDLDLMVDAGFSVIRVGESVWSTWEPSPGRFELEWLTPVLDAAHARGLHVVVGTPTYAVPSWLSHTHPEIAAEVATGVRQPWGYRQEVNVAHPTFRFYAERVIRAVIGRHAQHPAVIGFQVDNEPGLHLLHNADVFAGFKDFLRGRYGDVDSLNREWGLTFWSHRLRDWDELWPVDGNHSPQYQIEWRRFQAHVVNTFIGWQADVVREYARPDQFVTTCISYERPAVDDVAMVKSLDVTAGNPYYKMQESLRRGVDVRREEMWWSSGVWGLFEQGDRMYSTSQSPFFVTETNAQSIGQSHWQNHTPYPGQIKLAAMALISRGARMIEYWQWQTLHFGIETYWGGVLPHSGRPGRIYREVAELGHTIKELEPQLVGYQPDADVTFLYSMDTKWSFGFYPPLADDDGGPDRDAYLRIFDSFYRGAFDADRQARILHLSQLLETPVDQLVHQNPVLVVPSLYVAGDAALDVLVEYAKAGGHLVLGIRTGYGDDLARARPQRAPARLGGAAGIWYDEYSTLDTPARVGDVALDAGPVSKTTQLALDEDAGGTGWADALQPDGCEVLARFEDGLYAGGPAVTTNQAGSGRITYVGTVPSASFARSLMAWAVPQPIAAQWERGTTVTVSSGHTTSHRVWFVSNWSPEPASVCVPTHAVANGDSVEAGTRIELAPWSVKPFVTVRDDRRAPVPETGNVLVS
jgi:beta-galactosidase